MGFRQAAGDEEPAARVSLPEKAPCLYSGRISRRTGSRDSISQLSAKACRDEVEAEWRIITPIEEAWAQLPTPDFPNYAAGTEGPASWQELLEIRGNTAERSGNESLQGQPAYTRSLSASPLSLHSCSRPEDSLPCPNA
jgi:hypothetical protein